MLTEEQLKYAREIARNSFSTLEKAMDTRDIDTLINGKEEEKVQLVQSYILAKKVRLEEAQASRIAENLKASEEIATLSALTK